jgi:hypothetical protein
LFINICNAELYTIKELPVCYGPIRVKVIHSDIANYTIAPCNYDKEYWNCECNNNTVLQLDSNLETGKLTFMVEYYIAPLIEVPFEENETHVSEAEIENENNKRTIRIENYIFEKPKTKQGGGFTMEGMTKAIIFIIIAAIFLIGVLVVAIWKMFFKKEKEKISKEDKIKIDNAIKTNENVDDDIVDILKNLK